MSSIYTRAATDHNYAARERKRQSSKEREREGGRAADSWHACEAEEVQANCTVVVHDLPPSPLLLLLLLALALRTGCR